MAFPRKLLNDTEEVVLDLNPHWWFIFWQTVALVASLVLGVFALTTDSGVFQVIAGVLILAALGWWGARFADWKTTDFVVTTDRLIYRHGVLAKRGIEIPLERVNNVIFSQSIFERILRAGDLVIESAGESGRQAFSDVRKPSAVQNEIYRQIEDNENRKFDRIGNAGGGSVSVADELGKLDDLRERGVISEAEFVAQKARLLER
ncbi:MAG: PH domain-containing protein [Acidimicrobiales bacterium]|nr:PH domain-containing protein [Acidimicrobiales bacterium]